MKKPKHPGKLPEGFNAWVWNKKTGEVFPANFIAMHYWENVNGKDEIIADERTKDWEILHSDKEDIFAGFCIVALIGLVIYFVWGA